MDAIPTRATLLFRLRDRADDESWAEFAEIYTPLFYSFCLKRGLEHADASDIVQEVMRSVAQAMAGFEYDPEKGKFKTWLFTVVRNAIYSHFRKQARRPVTSADSQFLNRLESQPDEREQLDWERDYQRLLLAWAMAKIRPSYSPHIWTAFEQSTLRARPLADVAAQLDMTPNAVAVARHRITRKLRETAQSVDAESWEREMITRAQLD